MINARGKNRPGLDKWFVIASAVLAGIMIATVVYSIVFLSNSLFRAFIPGGADYTGAQFNLEGYSEVIEELGRTPSVQNSTSTN
ncbi:MAG: hypothetical protein WD883_00240 [Candidatus Colwellbacteria bacterium]